MIVLLTEDISFRNKEQRKIKITYAAHQVLNLSAPLIVDTN